MFIAQITIMSVLVPALVLGLIVAAINGYCSEGANHRAIVAAGLSLLSMSIAVIAGVALNGAQVHVLGAYALIVSIVLAVAISVLLLFAGVISVEDAKDRH